MNQKLSIPIFLALFNNSPSTIDVTAIILISGHMDLIFSAAIKPFAPLSIKISISIKSISSALENLSAKSADFSVLTSLYFSLLFIYNVNKSCATRESSTIITLTSDIIFPPYLEI